MGGPQIAGLYSNYRKHDGLVATCRTRETLAGHRDNLTWFVNDRNVREIFYDNFISVLTTTVAKHE